MTYHTPELLLIGAAANLVLAESGQLKPFPLLGICDVETDEISTLQYDVPGNW